MPKDFAATAEHVNGEFGSWTLWDGEELLGRGKPLFDNAVVALGTFDGVHRGHRRILREAVELAKASRGVPVALTFDRHPAKTLSPRGAPSLLTSFDRRISLMLESGIAHVVVVRFDESFARLDAQTFIERIVLQALGAKGIVVGYNFRFGRGAAGDAAMLRRESDLGRFSLRVVPRVTWDGVKVSSTRIRALVEQGDVETAAALLGRPFAVEGKVAHGDRRGRTLGYPTANLSPSPELAVPGDGVYITRIGVADSVRVDSESPASPQTGTAAVRDRAGLTVVSARPTFGSALERTIESFILDFEGDLYEKGLEIAFLKRVRDIVRFDSPEALKRQIERDVAVAKAYLSR